MKQGISIIGFSLLVLSFSLLAPSGADTSTIQSSIQRNAVIVTIDGPIGPATSDYFQRSLQKAVARGASIVVLVMNTPGGLDTAMRDIIKTIITSPIPVATYVAPGGSRAASAGTYILYASHVAAMAPATNLGAATPVQIGGLPGLPSPEKKPPEQQEPQQREQKDKPPTVMDSEEAMRHKVVNDAAAYIRGLAELRGRNADWAEKAVREAVSLSAQEAMQEKVIDVIATDVADLLNKIHGKQVQTAAGEVVLQTQNLIVQAIDPDWRTRLLSILTNPNVAYILMLIGIYGLIFEFSSPGGIIPGVVGAICLLLALFAFQALPVNYAGLALMILGTGLMVAEAFAPSFGALGIGGVVAFVFGSVMLIDTEAPGFGISPVLIISVSLTSSLLFLVFIVAAVKARQRLKQTGQEGMVGEVAVALDDFSETGQVRAAGEIWNAETDTPVHKGQKLKVTNMDGLTLKVSSEENPKEENPKKE